MNDPYVIIGVTLCVWFVSSLVFLALLLRPWQRVKPPPLPNRRVPTTQNDWELIFEKFGPN